MKRNENLLVLMISIAFFLLLLGIGEFYCRFLTRINTFEINRSLFVPDRFGNSLGNIKNGEAMAFGSMCYTDENGFRIDPKFNDTNNNHAILFLGDSVGFGIGVAENQSAIGLLRRALPGVCLYNSSCIGYFVKDYKNVVDFFVPTHSNVKLVYVIMCLNDIYDESSVEIRRASGNDPQQAIPKTLATKAMKFAFFRDINTFLRSRSKLYVLLKNKVEDTSMRVFLYELQMYKNSEAYFEANMSVFRQMSDQLRKAGIRFKVIIIPYEAQLRSKNDAFMLPQKMIIDYFVTQGIDFVDSTEYFSNAGVPPAQLYLFGDPMHLSSAGNRVLYDILIKDIAATEPGEHPE